MMIPRQAILISRRVAFSIVELMVVVAIIVTLIAVTLPSFTTMVESSNFASAISQTTAALGNARALAMRDGVRTGVAFLFDVRTQRYTLMILQQSDADSGSDGQLAALATAPPEYLYTTVFSPAPNSAPIELPRGTAIYGLSFSHVPDPLIEPTVLVEPAIDARTWHWYAGERYLNENSIIENPWIFPRNDALLFWPNGVAIAGGANLPDPWEEMLLNGASAEVVDALRHANTFMVQYNPDGSVVPSFSKGSFSHPVNGYIEYRLRPIDVESLDPDIQPYDNPLRFDPEVDPMALGVVQGEANPEVLMRTVSQLAVVDLNQLRRGVGVRAPWFLHPSTSLAPWPAYDPDGRPGNGDEIEANDVRLDGLVSQVSAWIDANAEIIGFDRYTGAAMRRVGQ